MGDVAASGGYYMAAAADQVVAQPGSITGSIGVITGKFNASDALAQAGITHDAVQVRAAPARPSRAVSVRPRCHMATTSARYPLYNSYRIDAQCCFVDRLWQRMGCLCRGVQASLLFCA